MKNIRIEITTRVSGFLCCLCCAALLLMGVPMGASANTDSTNAASSASVEQMSSEGSGASADGAPKTPAAPTTDTAAESATVPDEAPESAASDDLNQETIADASLSLMAPILQSVGSNGNSLDVQISDMDGQYHQVTDYDNQTTDWQITDLRTMHVDFEFSNGRQKQIAVDIPFGYEIVGYSATDDTEEIEGVTRISIDPEYKAFFTSSVLTGTDGSEAWTDQVTDTNYWSGYESMGYPVKAGRIVYNFSNQATRGELVVTLIPQQELLNHSSDSLEELLPNISVQMTSSTLSGNPLEETFRGNVTGVARPWINYPLHTWGAELAYVPVKADGQTDAFGVLACTDLIANENRQLLLADSCSLTIHYPAGVTVDPSQFNCNIVGLGTVAQSDAAIPDHFSLTVSGNKRTGGTVVFTMTHALYDHSELSANWGAFFIADTNSRYINEGDTLAFTADFSMTKNGVTVTDSNTYRRTLVSGDSDQYLIDLWGDNQSGRDLAAAYPGYPYDQTLGLFHMDVKLPYEDVPLLFDYSDLPGVRGMALPGYHIRDLRVVTTTNRIIDYGDLGEAAADGFGGVPITAEMLNLADGEYVKTLTCLADLEQLEYGQWYADAFSYYGQFVNGQEGDAVFSILDENGEPAMSYENEELVVIDHTPIDWTSSGLSDLTTKVFDADTDIEETTFEPNETLLLQSYFGGAVNRFPGMTTIDPVLLISLPSGVRLDPSSVQCLSTSGNHGEDRFQLRQINVPYEHSVDGVEWTTYYFTSANPLDIVALEVTPAMPSLYGPGTYKTFVEVTARATVAANAPDYGQLPLSEIMQWDLGQPSDWYTTPDIHERVGKGADYAFAATGENITVKRLIGLNVDLGIRVKGSGTDYFTYDTSENSIAAITKSENAEVRVSFANTAPTDYGSGSSIYLPIPKIGNDYSKYFENIELRDPVNNDDTRRFTFNTYLASEASLPGFTTYYSMDATENSTSYNPSTNAGTWTPVLGTWYTYDQLTDSGRDLSNLRNVKMLKFEAQDDIESGVTGEGAFELSIDNQASIGSLNYWRAYSKAVNNTSLQTGVWNYSSVLAATPSSEGLRGQVFVDANHDGYFDGTDGDFAYADQHIQAILSRDDGSMENLHLAIDANGCFQTSNPNGTTRYLRSGDYTITFTNEDDTYLFSTVPGAQSSTGDDWYNDLQPADINEPTAVYHFTVDESTSLGSYVGIALSDFVEIISIDVPVKVKLAVNTDGSWCAPTARDNRIINHSNVAITTTDITSTATSGFTLLDNPDDQVTPNGFSGTVCANNGLPVLLGQAQTPPASQWTMSADNGSTSDRSDELALQLNGRIQNVSGHYFTAPIHLFDNTYTFEKAL